MTRGNKFGTFGGVFTPSILTILGVIMYLRLPWLVGNAGLFMVVGIILVAHVISVTTGLSVASIATDKRVKAGGPYYIVSRSLGLPIGGTLGIALFVGLSFSVSLYIIGFSESFLAFVELPATKENIRVCGSITLVMVTLVTLVSTAFAIKIQYVIMALIGLSLLSILGGDASYAPSEPSLAPEFEPEVSVAVLFGIFFPAVTGFTAGVNMSGDLSDPKRSLPRGTIWAIGAGLVTYVALAVFLAYRVDRQQLISNPAILLDMSLYAPLVVAGVWGATLSSALGSILGAPRILQATSVDRITPKIFAKGHGRTNEPRNPLLLTFGIAELGILIGDLDAIAGMVSMFFITTYGFLNVSCAIESWANPDFRPEFKIPRLVPVIGAGTCLIIMIQLDFLAMIAASTLLAGVFVLIKRRQLQLESGDTWEGVWSSLVRSGLHRLNRGSQQRQWRPNILAFSRNTDPDRPDLVEFAAALVSSGGVMTDFELVPEKGRSNTEERDPSVGIFHRRTPTDRPFETMESICRYHGFPGIEPNTLLLPYQQRAQDPEACDQLLRATEKLDFNTLFFKPTSRPGSPITGDEASQRIDIWWRPESGQIRFGLILARFLTASPNWRDAKLRFLIIHKDAAKIDAMQQRMARLLDDMRVTGDIKFIDADLHDASFYEFVRQESEHTHLSLIGLPDPDARTREDSFTCIQTLEDALGDLVLYRCAREFGGLFDDVRRIQLSLTTEAIKPEQNVDPLRLPSDPQLAREVAQFSATLDGTLTELCEGTLRAHVAREGTLLNDLERALNRAFSALEKSMTGASKRRQKKLVARAQSSFLFQSRQLLTRFVAEDLSAQREGLQAAVVAFEQRARQLTVDTPRFVTVWHPRAAFAKDPEDSGRLRRFKLRKRWASLLQGDTVKVHIPLGALVQFHVQEGAFKRHEETLRATALDSMNLAADVRRLIQSVHHALAILDKRVEEGDVEALNPGEERARISTEFLDHVSSRKQRLQDNYQVLIAATRATSQALALDTEDLAVIASSRRLRRLSPDTTQLRNELPDAPAAFHTSQSLLFQRADLELQMVSLHLRVATIVQRMTAGLQLRLQNSVLVPLEQFTLGLKEFSEELQEEQAKELRYYRDTRHSFEARVVLDDLIREIHGATGELPETLEIIDDATVAELESTPFAHTTPVSVPLRRMVEALMEREFFGRVHELLFEIEESDQRGQAIVGEVLRLIAFNLGDFEGGEAAEMADLMAPVATNSLERCDGQLGILQTLSAGLKEDLNRLLGVMQAKMNSYAILREVKRPTEYLRPTDRLFPTFSEFLNDMREGSRRGLTKLHYRRRSAILAARRLTATRPVAETVIDRMLAFTHAHSPNPEVAEGLPFYYRQLFLGRSTVSEDFWVGREAELEQGRRAIENNRAGYRGSLMVTGAAMSGKSAYCRHLTQQMFDRGRVIHVFPPRAGSVDVARFKRSLSEALEVQGELADMFQSIEERSAIVLHDVELWWNRRRDGLEIIQLIMRLIEDYGGRTLFVLNMNTHAFRLIAKLVPLADHALSVVDCGPMQAEELRDALLLRHRSTGHRFRLEHKREEQMSEWAMARVFTGIFDYSRGLVGVALQAWISHITHIERATVALRCPKEVSVDLFDELRMEWIAILIQFALHKRLTRERMIVIMGGEEEAVGASINTLIRMGLLFETSAGVLELNRFVGPMVNTYLVERGLLP